MDFVMIGNIEDQLMREDGLSYEEDAHKRANETANNEKALRDYLDVVFKKKRN